MKPWTRGAHLSIKASCYHVWNFLSDESDCKAYLRQNISCCSLLPPAVGVISTEVTYILGGLVFAWIVEEWVWDYAITVTLLHIAMTVAGKHTKWINRAEQLIGLEAWLCNREKNGCNSKMGPHIQAPSIHAFFFLLLWTNMHLKFL